MKMHPNILSALLLGILVPVLALLSAPGAFAQDEIEFDTLLIRQVGPGVMHIEYIERTTPWTLDVLEVDLTDPFLQIETANAQQTIAQGYETTSSMAARNDSAGHRVVGAVNGDFYSGSVPVGSFVQEGEFVREGVHGRPAVSFDDMDQVAITTPFFSGEITANNSSIAINHVNGSRGGSDLVLYNHYLGESTGTDASGVEVAIQPLNGWVVNDTLRVVVTDKENEVGNMFISDGGAVLSGRGTAANFLNTQIAVDDTLSVLVNLLPGIERLDDMISGQPVIVRDGEVDVGPRGDGVDRHPRTAVGFSEDRETLFLVTVDGRQRSSAGMDLYELGDFMTRLGVHKAINVDGGGSSTMVVRSNIVNGPSGGGTERSIGSNALLVVSTAPQGPLNEIQISPTHEKVFMGRNADFSVRGADEYYNTVALDASQIAYDLDPGLGAITDEGAFTAGMQQDTGYVYVAYDGQYVDSALVIVKTIADFDLYPPEIVTDTSRVTRFYVRAFDQDGFEQSVGLSTYEWTSTNPSVGTVENGRFRGHSAGATTVVATFRTLSDSSLVSVTAKEGTSTFLSLENTTGWSLAGENIDAAASQISVSQTDFTEGSGSFRVDYSYQVDPTELRWVYLRTDIPIEGAPDSMHIDAKSSNTAFNQVYLLIEDVQGNMYRVFGVGFANTTDSFIELSGSFDDAKALEGDPPLYFPVRLKGISLKVRHGTEAGETYNETMFLDNLRLSYSTTASALERTAGPPARITLHGNYPNPFQETTTITYALPQPTTVVVRIYDVLGRRVRAIRPGLQEAGTHELRVDARELPAGVYFYQLEAGEGHVQSEKMLLVK